MVLAEAGRQVSGQHTGNSWGHRWQSSRSFLRILLPISWHESIHLWSLLTSLSTAPQPEHENKPTKNPVGSHIYFPVVSVYQSPKVTSSLPCRRKLLCGLRYASASDPQRGRNTPRGTSLTSLVTHQPAPPCHTNGEMPEPVLNGT